MTALTPAAMRDPRVRFSWLALGVAAGLFIWAFIGAYRVEDVIAAAPPAAVPDSALRFAAAGSGPDIAGANARDLFTDDRRAPERRYLMPGDADTPRGGPAPLPAVLGTAIGSDGAHFAIAQVPGGLAKIIRANDKIGEYTVISIERARVILRGSDGNRVTVDASKP